MNTNMTGFQKSLCPCVWTRLASAMEGFSWKTPRIVIPEHHEAGRLAGGLPVNHVELITNCVQE